VVGIDPQLIDPKHGDFRPEPGSPATAYGCQTFPSGGLRPPAGDAAAALRTLARGVSGARSSIAVSGAIVTDTLWDADTVRVVGNVDVENGVTLEVAPGTWVEFEDFYSLTVHGRILAVGTAEDAIVFTTDEPEAFAVDTTAVGCWNGIRFPWTSSMNQESRLEHCVLEYSKGLGDEPFGGALSVVGFSKLLVRNSTIRSNVAGYGGAVFCSHHAAPVLVGNLIEGNSAFVAGAAIYDLYAYPDVTNCTIVSNVVLNDEQFDATGTIHNHISKPRVTGSVFRANSNVYFIPTELLESKAFYTTFSDVEGGHDGEGNVDEDPLFIGSGAVSTWAPTRGRTEQGSRKSWRPTECSSARARTRSATERRSSARRPSVRTSRSASTTSRGGPCGPCTTELSTPDRTRSVGTGPTKRGGRFLRVSTLSRSTPGRATRRPPSSSFSADVGCVGLRVVLLPTSCRL